MADPIDGPFDPQLQVRETSQGWSYRISLEDNGPPATEREWSQLFSKRGIAEEHGQTHLELVKEVLGSPPTAEPTLRDLGRDYVHAKPDRLLDHTETRADMMGDPTLIGRLSPDFLITRAWDEKHHPEQNQRHTTTPPSNPQGELQVSDHQNVKEAERDLREAKTEEKVHDLDFWQRTALAGKIADQTHQQTQKETIEDKPAKQPTP